MPYVPPAVRALLTCKGKRAITGGELNYIVSRIVDKYVEDNGLRYSVIAEIRDALAGCSAEFERKVAFPYEDLKCQQNGEVFTASLNALEDAKHPEVSRG